MAPAICSVSRSCTCSRRAKTSTTRGSFDRPDDAAARDVGDVHPAEERQHVVLAQRVELDVAHHHHVLVRLVEQRVANDLSGVHPVTPREPRERLRYTLRSLDQPLAVGILAQQLELAADHTFELRRVHPVVTGDRGCLVTSADFGPTRHDSRPPGSSSRALSRPGQLTARPVVGRRRRSPWCLASCVPHHEKQKAPPAAGPSERGVRRGVFEAQSNVLRPSPCLPPSPHWGMTSAQIIEPTRWTYRLKN